MALRRVCVAQPRFRAISFGPCFRLEESLIWLRRRVKTVEERNPAVSPFLLLRLHGSDIHGGFHALILADFSLLTQELS